ncbi:MAG: hypothetical protein GWN00_04785, partial [Aliifodinibius sp.]|nr:hypothetical protein [Fodinibius sp.]NIV10532.1 hypothetical protein [Fodinibius sp.]NIY24143.1 hypothetical protein [Fodinibius sp.]
NEELSIQAKLLPIPEQIFFKADSGLKIFINKKIKTELSANKLQSLTNDLKELEKAKVLVWQEDIHKEMEKERERFKQELDSLQVKLQRLQQTHQLKQIEIQGVIKSISQLDSLNLPVRVNIDSIRKEVEMELRGVKEAKKKE